MPRNITLDHIRIMQFSLKRDKPTGEYEVQVSYLIEDASDVRILRRTISRYSSGHSGTPKLPAGWESDFDSLLTAMTTAVTNLENL